MSRLNIKQKEILAQFYSNFSLAWFTLGIVSPIFNPVENVVKLIIGIMVSIGLGSFFFEKSLQILEK